MNVYSKKVDFLYHEATKMVDLLGTNSVPDHVREGEEAPRGPRGSRRGTDVPREFEDIHVAVAKNIQLRFEEEDRMKEKKDALKFIYITPSQLVEKEGSEQKAVKVNMFTGVQHSRWDLLAAKEDFRINSQYVQETGFLGAELSPDNVYRNLNLVPEDSVGEVETSLPMELEAETEFPDHLDVDQGQPDLESGQNNSRVSETAAAPHRSLSRSVSVSGERLPLVFPLPPSSSQSSLETWQPLDPHQELRSPRPLKIKPTRRLPPSRRAKEKSPIIPISQFLSQQHPANDHSMLMPSYVPRSCYDLLLRQKRLVEKENEKSEEIRDQFVEELQEGTGEEDEAHGFEVNFEDNYEDFHLLDPHLGGDLGALAVENIEAENDSLSYEELVARRVEDFITRSKDAMSSSELSQRVSGWHEMIGPRLENLERRKPFDIHDYGTKILAQVETAGGSEVAFRRIVRGQKKEEISRYDLVSKCL